MEKRPFFRAATPLRPYRGNTARADMAGLGSIGFSILAGDARSFFVRIKSDIISELSDTARQQPLVSANFRFCRKALKCQCPICYHWEGVPPDSDSHC